MLVLVGVLVLVIVSVLACCPDAIAGLLTACTNTPGGRSCGSCPQGYTGDGEAGCTDVDECATDNGGCDALSASTNTEGGRTCGVCPEGYTGDGATGCTDPLECASDNGGCGDPRGHICDEVVGGAPACRCNEWPDESCAGGAGRIWRRCSEGTFYDRCLEMSELGAGECRQDDGSYALEFSVCYPDLDPHTAGDNALEARERCQQTCLQYPSWCYVRSVPDRRAAPRPFTGIEAGVRWRLGAFELALDALLRLLWLDTRY